MKRLLLLLLLLPIGLRAQHIAIINFSHGVAGATLSSGNDGGVSGRIAQSWYGSYGGSAQGCSGQVPCVTISNSSGGLTYSNTPVCGPVPTVTGSPIMLDYNPTLAGGSSNQIVGMQFPSSGVSTVVQFVVLFCSNIPATQSFGTTGDMIQMVSPNNQLSNYNCQPGSCWFALEHGVLAGTHPMPYTVGTWVQLAGQYVIGGTCADTTFFTDCQRLGEYDLAGNQIGTPDYGSGGGAGSPAQITLGNGNGGSFPAGNFHVQFAGVKMCLFNCNVGMFPMKFTPAPPTDGLIPRNRTTDWTRAGIPGNNAGTLPSSAWTQFGSTLTAGSYTGATITASTVGCNNQFLRLGAGTFTVSGGINLPSNCELRGLGADTTSLIMVGASATCRTITAAVCIKTTGDGTFIGNIPAVSCNWTAGYAQGATQVTLSACTGAGITSIVPGTILALNQCGTGFTGANNCTGTAVDNGGLYMCLDRITATPTGCSANGGGTYERPTIELPVVTAINTGTGVATISPPLTMPNYASGQTPQAQIIQPATMAGVKDMSIDLSATGADSACVELYDAYKVWIRGVRCLNNKFEAFAITQTANYIVEDNYLYGTTATPPSGYGIRPFYSAYGLVANNISQNVYTPMFQDSPTMATVWAYNFVVNNNNPGNTFMNQAFTDHWPNCYTLAEGNIANQFNPDDAHGAACVDTTNRNLFTGWESTPATPKSSNTVAIQDQAFTRFHNHIFDVLGTPGYHTLYSTLGNNNSVLWLGQGVGGVSPPVPSDSLTASTTIRYGSYNVVQAAVRLCGTSLNTGWVGLCGSASESALTAPTLPGFAPAIGDAAIGQPPAPASFIFTTRPSWYPNSKPFPLIGPDVTGGNLGQCSGALNVVGQFNGVPALTNAQCGGHGITASAWAGHVNSNSAMDCYLNVMNGPVDGSGAVLSFNADNCYAGAVPAPIASFSPSTANVGQVPLNLTSNPSGPYTLTNIGTANLVNTSITLPNSLFSIVSNTCGSPATITSVILGTGFTLTPGQFCTFNVTATPTAIGGNTANAVFTENTAGGSDILALSATGTGTPSPSTIMFAGIMSDRTLCPVVPATTQLCYSLQCACMWISMNGGSYIPMGVSSVNGLSGKVVLPIPTKAVSTTTTVIQ